MMRYIGTKEHDIYNLLANGLKNNVKKINKQTEQNVKKNFESVLKPWRKFFVLLIVAIYLKV